MVNELRCLKLLGSGRLAMTAPKGTVFLGWASGSEVGGSFLFTLQPVGTLKR